MGSEFWQATGAIATAAATIVALWVSVREGKHRAADKRDAEAAQARLILVHGAEMMSGDVVPLRLTNHSAEPILWPWVTDVVWNEDATKAAQWRNPPTIFGARPGTDVLPAGDTFKVYVEFVHDDKRQAISAGDTFQTTFTFIDARGLRWQRVGNSEPTRLTGKRPGGWSRRKVDRV